MKPAFALSFSATGISLHHHSDNDWFCVGTVALDAPDLKTQIRALREKGFALENDLSCKVVIPRDQVRFLTTSTEGLSADEGAEKARAELIEATPYSLEELAFDTATVGPETYVAAIARQTLDEARDFAIEHGFIPVQYSTETNAQDFPSEPLFTMPDVDSAPDYSEQATALPEPEPDQGETTVHSIADTTAPEVFRSAPGLDGTGKIGAGSKYLAKRFAIPTAAAAVVLGLGLGTWAIVGTGTQEEDAEQVQEPPLTTQQTTEISPQPTPGEQAAETAATLPDVSSPETAEPDPADDPQTALSATDAAILEALNVAPTIVEEVERSPEPEESPILPGIQVVTPETLVAPAFAEPSEQYLASIDDSNISSDAVALPPAESFDTDAPFEQIALPSSAGIRFELDERGLVTPTVEGTLNPDGVTVYLGRPSKVPPDVPVRFEQEPIAEDTNDRLAGLRPRPRPENLIERFERQQLGGRTREELAILRPKLRPKSIQEQPQIDETPTALAVVRVPRPKNRPAGLAASATKTANLGSTAAVNPDEANTFQPKAVAPKIPSSASVARQATLDNALNLRKLNLIGVYGTPANRRALVRLPSGRYKKLKVGDRLDGGNVIAIGDSELRYQKRGKNVTLNMPRG